MSNDVNDVDGGDKVDVPRAGVTVGSVGDLPGCCELLGPSVLLVYGGRLSGNVWCGGRAQA